MPASPLFEDIGPEDDKPAPAQWQKFSSNDAIRFGNRPIARAGSGD